MKHEWTGKILLIAAVILGGCEQARPAAGSPGAATSGARVAITVGPRGYEPTAVNVPAGRPVTLVFTRTTDEGCGAQLVFPSLNIRRDLPLNRPVEVALTPTAGTIAFTCGMNMMRGSIVAQ